MRILLFGSSGQLGTSLLTKFPENWNITSPSEFDADFLKPDTVLAPIKKHRPDLVINAAAYTNVDQAETDCDFADQINHRTVSLIASRCAEGSIPLIHVSTDYVFDGKKGEAYLEDDPISPINSYGLSKHHGEESVRNISRQHMIFRTSWLYNLDFPNFITKSIKWLKTHEEVKIVGDKVSSPTWSDMMAETIITILQSAPLDELFERSSGTYHLSCQGQASRYSMTELVLKTISPLLDLRIKNLQNVNSDEFPTPAARPDYSPLDCTKIMKTFDLKIPTWQECLQKALIQKYG